MWSSFQRWGAIIATNVVLWSSATFCGEGGMSSNGGDLINQSRNPWFLGDDAVTYCVEVNGNFSLGRDIAREFTHQALADWTENLINMGVPNHKTDFAFADGKKKGIAVNFFEQENCQGNESLVFQFGGMMPDSTVDGAIGHHAGIAAREGIDIRTGSTKRGIVWVIGDRGSNRLAGMPDHFWNSKLGPNAAYNILHHEIGHIFGIQHEDSSPGFIRDMLYWVYRELTTGNVYPITRRSARLLSMQNLDNPSWHAITSFDMKPNEVERVLGVKTNYPPDMNLGVDSFLKRIPNQGADEYTFEISFRSVFKETVGGIFHVMKNSFRGSDDFPLLFVIYGAYAIENQSSWLPAHQVDFMQQTRSVDGFGMLEIGNKRFVGDLTIDTRHIYLKVYADGQFYSFGNYIYYDHK